MIAGLRDPHAKDSIIGLTIVVQSVVVHARFAEALVRPKAVFDDGLAGILYLGGDPQVFARLQHSVGQIRDRRRSAVPWIGTQVLRPFFHQLRDARTGCRGQCDLAVQVADEIAVGVKLMGVFLHIRIDL